MLTRKNGKEPMMDARIDHLGSPLGWKLVNPVIAGLEVALEATLEAVTPKQTRSGPCVFVTTMHTFMSAEGAVLNRNQRTVVPRDPVQEP